MVMPRRKMRGNLKKKKGLRMYEHIKASVLKRLKGKGTTKRAKQIAAATVNKYYGRKKRKKG
jgi:hypothetical protein